MLFNASLYFQILMKIHFKMSLYITLNVKMSERLLISSIRYLCRE
jgi:hypothetical protein